MDAASLLLGLLVGALLGVAITLGVVALRGRQTAAPDALEPVHESLDHLHRVLAGIERDRATAHGELREQVGTIGQTSALLRQETAALVTALRTPHVRGRWGELQLRRVVEVAGLLEHCDFVEQPGGTTPDGTRVRPDLVVTLADGRQVIVDAKVPFTGYIEAVQATDSGVRAQRVADHARQLRAHVDELAARQYPSAFGSSAPFTVLFVPSDGFLTTALEGEPGLLEHGFARDVVIATPSTLLALLRTVAYSWRQERLAQDAAAVLEVGRTVHARLTTLSPGWARRWAPRSPATTRPSAPTSGRCWWRPGASTTSASRAARCPPPPRSRGPCACSARRPTAAPTPTPRPVPGRPGSSPCPACRRRSCRCTPPPARCRRSPPRSPAGRSRSASCPPSRRPRDTSRAGAASPTDPAGHTRV
jgi:DNA recombination protein RmuC